MEHTMVITERPQTNAAPLSTKNAIASLRDRLTGQLITPGSGDFDAARATPFRDGRHPLAIARVASAADVAAVVDVARDNGLPLAVRSGGHSVAGYSVVDDSVVIDFSRMKRVDIDPVTRIARVQPGATSGDLAGPAGAHGLALSTGDTHSVGMGGLVTGGGVGFMVRKHGLAIDNLVQAQVVTAAGEIVTASETSHPDLFWAIRGGGGNVGIVTEFTFRLAAVDRILGGDLMLPATPEVIRGYLDYATTAPDDLTMIAHVMHAPPAPYVPADRVGELVLSILVSWTGGIDDGQEALAPLRALATPVADAVAPMPYPGIYAFTAHQAEPHRASIRMMFADALSDAAVEDILAAMRAPSSPYSIVQLRGLGGAFGRVAPDATAFAHRRRRYFVAVIAIWLDPAEDRAPHEAWTGALWKAIRHEGEGVYVNFLEQEGPGRVREAYPGGTWERLAAVKHRYDPGNLFRFNQNVPPRP
jgi:FAD/FMN-containing dehydrogenase